MPLTAGDIRRAFAGATPPPPDQAPPPDPALVPAAVLCPVVERRSGLAVVLVRRSPALRRHAGQIGFPGGRVEASDRDTLAAALREAEEEIGLAPARVEPVGVLPRYRTGTGFEIWPHVGLVAAGFRPRPDGVEVVETLEPPLAFLLDPANRRRVDRNTGGRVRSTSTLCWRQHEIWGATAALLKAFADRVGAG